MKKVILFLLIFALLTSLPSCKQPTPDEPADAGPEVDENGYVTIEISKVTEKKEVNLDHPLYNSNNDDIEVEFDQFGPKNRKIKLEMYEYCNSLDYQEQDIRSVEQALSYYRSVDPWNLISEKDGVIVNIFYDDEYDAWCFVLVREAAVEAYMSGGIVETAEWIWFLSNGQFLCRVW